MCYYLGYWWLHSDRPRAQNKIWSKHFCYQSLRQVEQPCWLIKLLLFFIDNTYSMHAEALKKKKNAKKKEYINNEIIMWKIMTIIKLYCY